MLAPTKLTRSAVAVPIACEENVHVVVAPVCCALAVNVTVAAAAAATVTGAGNGKMLVAYAGASASHSENKKIAARFIGVRTNLPYVRRV